VLSRELPPEDLQTIGFALLASQCFYWKEEDNEPAETFYDWSAPEINLPLTYENIRIFRDRLFQTPADPCSAEKPEPQGPTVCEKSF